MILYIFYNNIRSIILLFIVILGDTEDDVIKVAEELIKFSHEMNKTK